MIQVCFTRPEGKLIHQAGIYRVPDVPDPVGLVTGAAGNDLRSERIAACGMHAALELLHFSKLQFQHELELTRRTHSDRRCIQRQIYDAEVGSRNKAIWVSVHRPVENIERFGPELKL
jgi:hypothetical protein